MFSRLITFGVIASILAVAPVASAAAPATQAADGDASLLAQVKQVAGQGQDAQTVTEVNQYVDQNSGIISAILRGYMNYIKQIQSISSDGSSPPPNAPPPLESGTAGAGQSEAVNAVPSMNGGTSGQSGGESNGAQASGALQTAEIQPSGGLRITGVQASGGLRTSHLAGYPSLPDVDPVSSVTILSADQMEYAQKVEKENKERKAYLMAHPEGYTY